MEAKGFHLRRSGSSARGFYRLTPPKGSLTSTEDGKTYIGTATLSGKQLKLKGCAVFGLICKTEYWTRLK
jgi:hypothetical protein